MFCIKEVHKSFGFYNSENENDSEQDKNMAWLTTNWLHAETDDIWN